MVKHVKYRATRLFPEHFCSSYNASIYRASQYWKQRTEVPARHSRLTGVDVSSFQASKRIGMKKHLVNADAGRDRSQKLCVMALYPLVTENFDRLRKAGVRFDL